jgi:crotonobetainyl-CoA:carnitine CoA-transferase CaiB-like acyl-CoA transferase
VVGWNGRVATLTARPMTAPLDGLRVIDLSTVLAGPNCARYLADFGADVIKVERPDGGDSLRGMAWRDPRDGEGLWWKYVNRNKRTIALDLKDEGDRAIFLSLLDGANVLVENFRPGTLERLGLGPDVLLGRNAQLVVVRVSGFGQTGPYAQRPGFASIAESMSGLAAVTGEPDGPPMLPPIALTDEVTGLAGAFAALVALRSGVGQVVDVNLLQTVLQILGPTPSLYRLTGGLQPRMGSALPYSVPRGVYQCRDGAWLGVSASSETVARRVVAMLGFADDERMRSFAGRIEHREEIEARMREWCSARTRDEAMHELERADAAAGPVNDMADVDADPHVRARNLITDVGATPMQGLIASLSATPGRLDWEGRPLDADRDEIVAKGWLGSDG